MSLFCPQRLLDNAGLNTGVMPRFPASTGAFSRACGSLSLAHHNDLERPESLREAAMHISTHDVMELSHQMKGSDRVFRYRGVCPQNNGTGFSQL